MSDDPADRILAAIAAVREEVGQLRAGMATREGLAQLHADLMERLGRLQEDLTRRLDTEIVNYGAAEQAERIARGASDEARALGEQVHALVRMVRRLESEVRQMREGGRGA
jgi:hypothetical protein